MKFFNSIPLTIFLFFIIAGALLSIALLAKDIIRKYNSDNKQFIRIEIIGIVLLALQIISTIILLILK